MKKSKELTQTEKISVQSIWTDDLKKLIAACAELDQESNLEFITYASLVGEINKKRILCGLSWQRLTKEFFLDQNLTKSRARHTLLKVANMIERTEATPFEIAGLKPSYLKLLVRYPDLIQDKVIRLETNRRHRHYWPSQLTYTQLRRLSLQLCRESGISYCRREREHNGGFE